ncbi:hypothetical protein hrd7_23850 [Leptolinea sp. HRD-7]|nr:hypothetical protein hrd7_23850 [Leptolinea sp. HRD-7]
MPIPRLSTIRLPGKKKSLEKPEKNIKPDSSASNSDFRQPLIEMRDIYKVYKTNAGEFTALKGINADFYPGQFVSIIGKSGSGKSTLLNMITGIDRPSAGKIQIGDTYLQNLTENQFSEWRGKNLGIVFQFFQLLPMLSLLENIILPMDFCQMFTPPEREARARELLEMVGLGDYMDKLPTAVSGGQVQCAAIARALANDPPIIVADEPTGNLDSKTAEMVLNLIDELVMKGKTVLVVTHDEAVARHASRTLVICDGELVDEDISKTLPHISHRSMLMLANQSVDFTRNHGEELFSRESEIPGLVIVIDGDLDIRNSDGRKSGRIKTGSVLSNRYLRNTISNGKVLVGGSRKPARLKVLSNNNLQIIVNQSRSFRAFIEEMEANGTIFKDNELESSI